MPSKAGKLPFSALVCFKDGQRHSRIFSKIKIKKYRSLVMGQYWQFVAEKMKKTFNPGSFDPEIFFLRFFILISYSFKHAFR